MPGKFELNDDPAFAEKLYELSLDGSADAEIGEQDTFGYFCLFDRMDNEDWPDPAYIGYADPQGFWTITAFDSVEDARAEWATLNKEWNDFDSEANGDE